MSLIQQRQMVPISGGTTVNPEHVAYVSPNFPNTFPYYSNITDANLAALTEAIDLIVVYPGQYTVDGLRLETSIHFMPGTMVTNTLGVSSCMITFPSGGQHRITGHGEFINYDVGQHVFAIKGEQVFCCLEFEAAVCPNSVLPYGILLEGPRTSPIEIKAKHCPVIRDDSENVLDNTPTLIVHCESFMGYYSVNPFLKGGYRLASIETNYINDGHFVYIKYGECIIDFKIAICDLVSFDVSDYGKLTLRHGIIISAEKTYTCAVQVYNNLNDIRTSEKLPPTVVLEQITFNCGGENVNMQSSLGANNEEYSSIMIHKNCTFFTLPSSIYDTITGIGPLCNVYGEGGGSCSNKAPVGISENVRTILVDTAVIV